ncbi:hypothetical protein JCM19046_1965 [Bacillus sp. JCM 19046]|uniref:Uncharacterized protein n=1 Tax=Shouchella xiaoxiensis TaxID=766895 RepID=A0ABS2SWM1_9BACI|nr:hypothetical protein [Shouchella xiaoxiensis]MBM7838854.1 hypothetical protein [Shouchella xiaoxiensis]GAF17451.1 hypothetical protein JCM19046_1965 [Bacillus sp. JCM 19046]
MKLAQITIIALVLFISGCSSNQNSFEEQRDEWPELAVVEAEIGSDWDNVSVENDQGNSRVLLYETDGDVMYKSVYVLSEQRLKIIHTHEGDEGLVFDNVIDE